MSKLVPKLRFKEFGGDWEEKVIGDVSNCIVPGRNKPKNFNGNLPWITTPNIKGKYIHSFNTNLFIDKEEAKRIGSKIVPLNSIIMSCAGELGILAITKSEIIINQQLHAFLPHENTNTEFLNYSLSMQKIYINQVATKTAVPYLNKNNCNSIPVNIPTKEEQQKIANTVSSLDSFIEAENKKVESLKKHKKGLMQKLFPLDGEKKPKLRFDGFSGDWEEKTLENLSNITMGSSPKSSFYNKNKEGVPLLQGNADIKNRKSYPRIYTTQITKECFENDILLSVRAPVGTVAKSNHYACIGRGISSIKAKKDNSQEWIYQWFLQFENRWSSISQGGTFEAVNSSDIKNLNILIPKLKEQQKIANTLSSIDSLIEAQTKKLEALKQHKKGLMQKLFVNKEEN